MVYSNIFCYSTQDTNRRLQETPTVTELSNVVNKLRYLAMPIVILGEYLARKKNRQRNRTSKLKFPHYQYRYV